MKQSFRVKIIKDKRERQNACGSNKVTFLSVHVAVICCHSSPPSFIFVCFFNVLYFSANSLLYYSQKACPAMHFSERGASGIVHIDIGHFVKECLIVLAHKICYYYASGGLP